MTQEELDALMAGGIDDEELAEDEDSKEDLNEEKSSNESSNMDVSEEKIDDDIDMQNYKPSANVAWPPPPPTEDHKMVYQLDDVTKDSEKKAGEVFDRLESINNFMMEAEENANEVIELIDSNIELFEKLCEKFPKVKEFTKALEDNKQMKQKVEKLIESAQNSEDEIMMTMDIMQYQDIHRQKIERVINVMRALSKYMSSLFEGKIEDEKRVGSAVHIHGDENTENVVSNDEIEELIANLGKK